MCNFKKKHIVKNWFLRALDRVSKEFDAMGDDAKETLDNDLEMNREIDESLGLSSGAKNAYRLL